MATADRPQSTVHSSERSPWKTQEQVTVFAGVLCSLRSFRVQFIRVLPSPVKYHERDFFCFSEKRNLLVIIRSSHSELIVMVVVYIFIDQ